MTETDIGRWLQECNGDVDYLPEDIPLIEEKKGEWISDGKYDYLEDCIIKDTETNKFYKISMSRAGSYYSDYEYSFEGFTEVVQKEVTHIAWVPVNSGKSTE